MALILSTALSLPAFGADASPPGSDVRWSLPASLSCLWRACAEFVPRDQRTVIRQHWRRDRPLPGEGMLNIPSGETLLIQTRDRGGQQLVFSGPGRLRLSSDGRCTVITPAMRGLDRNDAHTPSTPIVLPPLIAGARGTRYDFIMTPQGAVFVRVLEGEVELRWMDRPDEPGTRLGPGEAILIDPRELLPGESHRLSGPEVDKQLARLTRDLLDRMTRGSGLIRSLDAFLGLLEDTRLEAAPGSQQERSSLELFAAFSDLLVHATPAETARAARQWARNAPADPLAARALYLAWLHADAVGDAGLREGLVQDLTTGFPSSRWSLLVRDATTVKP